jgi:RNA polymerase sigma-70 factor (ECF subfamily)
MSPRAMAQGGVAPVDVCPAGVDTSESGMFTRLKLPSSAPSAERANALVRDNLRLVWRLLRRLGLSPSDADDATQRVFFAAVQRVERIQPGSERAFVCSTAVRIASKIHAASKKRLESELVDALDALADATPSVEDLADRHRARQLFDQVLDSMPLELKTVFVLFEIERLSTQEVAEALGIPRGTAASRLRRARADFEQRVHRLEARIQFRSAAR